MGLGKSEWVLANAAARGARDLLTPLIGPQAEDIVRRGRPLHMPALAGDGTKVLLGNYRGYGNGWSPNLHNGKAAETSKGVASATRAALKHHGSGRGSVV